MIEYRIKLEMMFDNSNDRNANYETIKAFTKTLGSGKITKDEYVKEEYIKLNKPFIEEIN